MAANRARILAAAARLFRARGIDAVSVAEVMHAAGMTHGGFYRHFPSKADLAAAAIDTAFASLLAGLDRDIAAFGRAGALACYIETYLAPAHAADPSGGCPVAALGSEIARQPEIVRAALARGMDAVAARFAPLWPSEGACRALLATLAGVITQVRALPEPDRVVRLAEAREALAPLLPSA